MAKYLIGRSADVVLFLNSLSISKTKAKSIVHIHDAFFFEEIITNFKFRCIRNNFLVNGAQCNKIITVSDFSKESLVKFMSLKESKVGIVPCGIDRTQYRLERGHNKQELKEKYEIWGDYYIYIGGIAPNKNLTRLIEGFSRVVKQGLEDKLVICGDSQEISDAIKKYGMEKNVVALGFVSEEQKIQLLVNAKALLYVSYYEGFGIPILEGMVAGIPVVTSNVASMPEVAGDAGILVNPYEVDEIVEGIIKVREVTENKETLNALLERGNKIVEKYNWQSAALRYKEIIINLVEE